MKAYNMHWLKIDKLDQAKKVLTQIGVDSAGIPYMAGKAITRVIKLEKVPSPAAQILKQEMLALGGDAAVNRELIVNRVQETDVILLGNDRQLKELVNKLKVQPFGLKKAAESLHHLLFSLEKSPFRTLNCRGIDLEIGKKTLLMGILNITPDSFSDGGKYFHVEMALKQAEQLVQDGADILDMGAESTRPGHRSISAEEEWARLEPVLRELVSSCQVPISIDTQKAAVAEKALSLGVHMINDIWGFQKDPEMVKVVGESQATAVLMHNQDGTEYRNLMGEVIEFLERSIEIALAGGMNENQIILDPGIGFGKTPEQNMEVLSRLEELKCLGYPVLLGVSRKSVIGRTLNLPVHERLEPTIALGILGVAAGVDVLRVHDVLEHRKAVLMADQIIRRKRGIDYEGR